MLQIAKTCAKLASLYKELKHSIFIVDKVDLQNTGTDITESIGENQTHKPVIKSTGNQTCTPIYTTTDITERDITESTPFHTTEKTSDCYEDKLERNSTSKNTGEKAVESGERTTKEATTDSSIRKTFSRDDEDTRNDAGETTSRNVSIH